MGNTCGGSIPPLDLGCCSDRNVGSYLADVRIFNIEDLDRVPRLVKPIFRNPFDSPEMRKSQAKLREALARLEKTLKRDPRISIELDSNIDWIHLYRFRPTDGLFKQLFNEGKLEIMNELPLEERLKREEEAKQRIASEDTINQIDSVSDELEAKLYKIIIFKA